MTSIDINIETAERFGDIVIALGFVSIFFSILIARKNGMKPLRALATVLVLILGGLAGVFWPVLFITMNTSDSLPWLSLFSLYLVLIVMILFLVLWFAERENNFKKLPGFFAALLGSLVGLIFFSTVFFFIGKGWEFGFVPLCAETPLVWGSSIVSMYTKFSKSYRTSQGGAV